MIFIAGISIALFISGLLLVKKEKSTADIFLLLWMVLNAVDLAFFYLLYSNTIYNFPYLLGLQFPLPLLHGVFLFYYVSSVTHQFPKKKTIAFVHLIPFIITVIYLIPFLLLPSEQKIEIFKSGGKSYATFQSVLQTSVFISGIVYVVWSSILLRKYKKQIKSQSSDSKGINLQWLQFLTYGLGMIWSLVIFTQNDILIFVGVSIYVILVGFLSVQQKKIFGVNEIGSETGGNQEEKINQEEVSQEAKEETAILKEKYVSSGLSEKKAEEYYRQLNKMMVQEKIYTNLELSLSNLASKLEIHPNYLSQIINEKESKTFYDYINGYRVEEFKRRIAMPKNQQFTLMAIAYDCGFNSKSSFNRYFKKITEQTPSQYVKALKC